jgi:hypothetical protein
VRALLRSGLQLRLECPVAACDLDAKLFLDRRAARRYGISGAGSVGHVQTRLAKPGAKSVRLRVTSRAGKRLRRAGGMKLTLQTTIRSNGEALKQSRLIRATK